MTLPVVGSRNLFALMALFGCISFPHMAAAYDVCVDGDRLEDANEDSSCVHEDMAEYGVWVHFNHVNNDEASEYDDLAEHTEDIRYGAGHEDEIDHIYGETGSAVTVGHFWDPDPDGVFNPLKQNRLDGIGITQGLLPNGWQKSQAYWSRALGEYAAGNLTDEFITISGAQLITNAGAYHFLGHVIHHMGDNTIPTHVSVISHAPLNRDSFENWMSNKYHLPCTVIQNVSGLCALDDLDFRVEYSPKTYNHRLTPFEEAALNFDYQPKLGRIDPLAYADLNFDIPEVPGVETPDDKLLWLLYTTNQIAEFFAADRNNVAQSDGEGEAKDPTGWAQADLNRMAQANPSLRPQTVAQISDDDSCDCDAPPEQDLSSIRKYSYLRGIRAIGGLANLFQQTVTTKPILSIEIDRVQVVGGSNGTCDDTGAGVIPVPDVCDFYSRVAFSDVSTDPIPLVTLPVIRGQNDGDQQEDDDDISPTNWKWGHAVEPSGYARIQLEIIDDDDFPFSDSAVRIAPYLADIDSGGKMLTLEVDLAKCLKGEAGAIVAKDVFLGGVLSGQISSSVCGQSISTSVTGDEDENDGIAKVTFTVKMGESTPPEISCAAPDGIWHADDVSIACTATDESSLANPDDATFLL